jgi:hypothetical protein
MTDTISRIMKIRDGMTPDPLARAIVEREIAALQRHSSPDSASVQALTAAMSLISQKITKLDWSRDECRRKGQAVYVSNLTEQIEAWGDHLSAIKELMNATPVTDAAATPSNPTACPTSDPSWPESQPCSICGAFGPWFDTPQNGECVEATGGDAMADEVQAATPPRYIVDGLPELPDDDADFTPYLARKIIAKYQELLRGVAQQARPSAFLAWAVDMFGPIAKLRSERLLRFIEEAIELAHAEGMEREVFNRVADRVYSRPAGDTPKEIGQAQACLETFAEQIGLSSSDEAQREWERVQKIQRTEWERRHAAKAALGIALPSTDGSTP